MCRSYKHAHPAHPRNKAHAPGVGSSTRACAMQSGCHIPKRRRLFARPNIQCGFLDKELNGMSVWFLSQSVSVWFLSERVEDNLLHGTETPLVAPDEFLVLFQPLLRNPPPLFIVLPVPVQTTLNIFRAKCMCVSSSDIALWGLWV